LDLKQALKERDDAIKSRDFTRQWYAERIEAIKEVAKREGVWDEVASILANGSATRQLEGGNFYYDTPTYSQLFNGARNRADRAIRQRDQLCDQLHSIGVKPCIDRYT